MNVIIISTNKQHNTLKKVLTERGIFLKNTLDEISEKQISYSQVRKDKNYLFLTRKEINKIHKSSEMGIVNFKSKKM